MCQYQSLGKERPEYMRLLKQWTVQDALKFLTTLKHYVFVASLFYVVSLHEGLSVPLKQRILKSATSKLCDFAPHNPPIHTLTDCLHYLPKKLLPGNLRNAVQSQSLPLCRRIKWELEFHNNVLRARAVTQKEEVASERCENATSAGPSWNCGSISWQQGVLQQTQAAFPMLLPYSLKVLAAHVSCQKPQLTRPRFESVVSTKDIWRLTLFLRWRRV